MIKVPRMLYLNGPWDFLGDRMRASYVEPFHRLLAQDFEVVSVEGDCDLKQEVEACSPDIILFNTGTESALEPEIRIKNTDAYRNIPRIGYINRDPISPSRLVAMNRLRTWGVDQVFTCFRRSDSPGPFFDNAIYVPWWIDDRTLRDYGEPKRIPITLAGAGWLSSQFFYTWRYPVFAELMSHLPVYHVPVFETHKSDHAYVGEGYARLLNRSLFSGGCGSINRFLTMKPLEIPACRTCLVTEETEVMKAIGFRDGINCVFATGSDVVEKVRALLDDRERLKTITDAGFQLVHDRHTQRNRKMFIEWYCLWKEKAPGQRVVQDDPFGPLRLSDDPNPPAQKFPTENPLLDRLQSGYAFLAEQKWSEALQQFESVLQIIGYMAEARLGAAIALGMMGKTDLAIAHVSKNCKTQVYQRSEAYPDTINLAYLVAFLLKSGSQHLASNVLKLIVELKHPSINALRWHLVQKKLIKKRLIDDLSQVTYADESVNVETLHSALEKPFESWLRTWEALFAAK